MTRSHKNKSARAKKQASTARIRKNNAVVRAKATALARSGIFPKTIARDVTAPLKGGVKALTSKQKYARRQVNKLFKEIDASFFDEKLKPLPSDRIVKASKVSKLVANQARQQGYTVVKKGTEEYVIHTKQERVKETGEIIRAGKNYTARFMKISASDLEENEDGETPLYRKIKRRFEQEAKKENPQALAFYFKANQTNVHSLLQFSDADEMYEYLMRYDEKLLGELNGLAILTYSKTKQHAKKTGAHIKKIRKAQTPKPRGAMTERQRDHARNMERIRYALKKNKPKA